VVRGGMGGWTLVAAAYINSCLCALAQTALAGGWPMRRFRIVVSGVNNGCGGAWRHRRAAISRLP